MSKPNSAITLVTGFAGFYLLFAGSVSAQSPAKSITVEPFLQEITLSKADKQKNFEITVINNTSGDYIFRPLAVDFGSLDETGGLLFAGADAPALVKKYGLANWLVLDQSPQKLAPGQRTVIKARLDNREDLTPGSHYAAVVLSSDQLANTIADGQKISLQKNIASLVFSKKLGGESYGIELISVKGSSSLYKLPSNLELRFKNIGNVHLYPRGTVQVRDNFGRAVSEGIINSESGIVLPESIRKYGLDLRQITRAWWPGYYQLEVKYRYDGQANFATSSSRFFYIGSAVVLASLLLVSLTVIGLWRVFRHRRRLSKSTPVDK